MRKQICSDTSERRIRIAWVSFQPDGSISFGLNDRSYISPKFREASMIWNAYNRVKAKYIIASHPEELEAVKNPHFTYHPPIIFQFKDDRSGKEYLFRGIADVGITLEQKGYMPWIRAVTAPLTNLPSGGRRQDNISVDELAIRVSDEELSVCVAIDFIKPENVRMPYPCEWDILWHDVAIRISLSMCPPQIATLSWFHFH